MCKYSKDMSDAHVDIYRFTISVDRFFMPGRTVQNSSHQSGFGHMPAACSRI